MLPFPGRRDLFVLAAGLLLGVLLGPSVLEAASPDAYRALFGGAEAHAVVEEVRAQAETAKASIRERSGLDLGEGEGPRGEARERVEAQVRELGVAIDARVAAADRAVAAAMDNQAVRWVLGLLVALVGVSVAEVRAAPQPAAPGRADAAVEVPAAVRRLITVRYALLAVLVAVVMARATLYEAIPWFFVLALLGVSLAAAWVPLGRRPAGGDGAAPGADPTPTPAPTPGAGAGAGLDAGGPPADEARG